MAKLISQRVVILIKNVRLKNLSEENNSCTNIVYGVLSNNCLLNQTFEDINPHFL